MSSKPKGQVLNGGDRIHMALLDLKLNLVWKTPIAFLLIMLQITLGVRCVAYNEFHGPYWPGDEPMRFALTECAGSRIEPNGEPVAATCMDSSRVTVMSIEAESGFELTEISIETGGRSVFSGVRVSDFAVKHIQLFQGDLNQDRAIDFVVFLWAGGLGLASGFNEVVFILSSGDGYRVSTVMSLFPGPEDFVDFEGDGICEFIYAAIVYGPPEMAKEGGIHNFWVYNLIRIQNDSIGMANESAQGFPKWIWFSHSENHDETDLLSTEQKLQLWKDYGKPRIGVPLDEP